MDPKLVLRLLERMAERLQLVSSAADIRLVGQRLQEDITFLRNRLNEGVTSEPVAPVDLDAQ